MAKRKNGNGEEPLPNVARTSAGLREAMFDEMDRLRQGKTNATSANAMAKLAMTIVETVEMEINVAKALRDLPAQAEKMQLGAPVELGV